MANAPDAASERAQRIRVLLAEDQAMIRQALAALLSFEDDIEVVAQVGRGDEVVAAAAEHDIDVALLDIEMPGMDGLTAAAELRRAMESGVSAFLVKDSPADKLAETVRRALAGGRVIDPDLAAAALAEGINPLTQRERQVLAASADGSLNSEIAGERCGITCRPVSRRPAPATAPKRCGSPRNAAGSAERDARTLVRADRAE